MHIEQEVKVAFPGICIVVARVAPVMVAKRPVPELLEKTLEAMRDTYDLEGLNEYEEIQAYRKFMWKVGIDPTKIRPSAEALIRRVLSGNGLYDINNLVDAYNCVSMQYAVPLSAYDSKKVSGKLRVRFAEKGEVFEGHSGKEMELEGKEVVLADEARVLCLYPYRDTSFSQVKKTTQDVVLVGYGVPGIERSRVKNCVEEACDEIRRECGGKVQALAVLD